MLITDFQTNSVALCEPLRSRRLCVQLLLLYSARPARSILAKKNLSGLNDREDFSKPKSIGQAAPSILWPLRQMIQDTLTALFDHV